MALFIQKSSSKCLIEIKNNNRKRETANKIKRRKLKEPNPHTPTDMHRDTNTQIHTRLYTHSYIRTQTHRHTYSHPHIH